MLFVAHKFVLTCVITGADRKLNGGNQYVEKKFLQTRTNETGKTIIKFTIEGNNRPAIGDNKRVKGGGGEEGIVGEMWNYRDNPPQMEKEEEKLKVDLEGSRNI